MTHLGVEGDRNFDERVALNRREFLSQGGMAAVAAASVVTTVSRCFAKPSSGAPAVAELPATTELGIAASFQGTPKQIGAEYGKRFAPQIEKNFAILLGPGQAIPRQAPDFRAWVKTQERLIDRHWPWYIEEMHGVAEAIGKGYEEVILLNLRAWQFNYYGAAQATHGCSSLAITLADGRVACTGALDDPLTYYCGPVRIVPDRGHRFISFPITGTSWGNRGMNSAGLSVGISSQILPGLKRLEHTVVQDVAMRAMLQTCATVGDAREFCRQHPFTLNLVCVDAQGGIFCAQHTAAGLLELPASGSCALTNHIVDDENAFWLRERGVTDFPQSPTTRPRRGNLLRFLHVHQGKCSPEDVWKFVGTRDDANPGTIHNRGSIYMTYACPQASQETFWIMQPKLPQNGDRFQVFNI